MADVVDELVEQWRRVRPDLEPQLAAMATVGRLGRVVALATRTIEAVFEAHGLSIGEFDVLAALRRQGRPHELTPTALARMLMLSPAGMTSRLDRLEAAGLLERRADPDDRRSTTIHLTPAGLRRVDAAVVDHLANEELLLGLLSANDRRQLDRVLRKLLAALGPD